LNNSGTIGLQAVNEHPSGLGSCEFCRLVRPLPGRLQPNSHRGAIEVYDNFCHANDPYEEHDFGSFEADGRTIFFKIDYYDSTLTVHSPDPSDPAVTKRVITIMLAEEY
jgi:hypothetical protein